MLWLKKKKWSSSKVQANRTISHADLSYLYMISFKGPGQQHDPGPS